MRAEALITSLDIISKSLKNSRAKGAHLGCRILSNNQKLQSFHLREENQDQKIDSQNNPGTKNLNLH